MRLATPRAHDQNPNLIELARAKADEGGRALLVVYPRDACSGSASAVIIDARGRFLGAVAPGTAALLRVPADTGRVATFSSVEVTTWDGDHAAIDTLDLEPAPAGLLLRTWRPASHRGCGGGGQFVDAALASKEQLESALAEHEITWLAPDPPAGQAWLDAHHTRVANVLLQASTTATHTATGR